MQNISHKTDKYFKISFNLFIINFLFCFQKRKPRSKSKMLFEDEDVLFGGTPAESPPVDLFAAGSPVSPTKVRSCPSDGVRLSGPLVKSTQ